MFKFKKIFAVAIVIFFAQSAYSRNADDASNYPDGETVKESPILFYWKDIRKDEENKKPPTFRILIENKEMNISQSKISPPQNIMGFYLLTWDSKLNPGKYSYTIDMFTDGSVSNPKYYGYRKYPLKGSFYLEAPISDRTQSAEDLILEKETAHYNLLQNGYNVIFYGSSSAILTAGAVLFLTVLDYNIVTKVTGYLCAGSAVAGFTATGYYSYKFLTFDRTDLNLSVAGMGTDTKSVSAKASFKF